MRPITLLAALLAATAAPSSSVLAQATSAATTTPEVALAPGEGRTVAASLADYLERDFIIPAHGRDYAAMLRANLAAGRYDRGGRAEVAKRLTDDLQSLHRDGHLAVRVTQPASAARPKGWADADSMIQAAKTIAPGIAYIRFSAFFGRDGDMAKIRQWLDSNRGAETLIFDLRNHHGGGLDEQDLLFSKLFAARVPLVKMEMAKAVFDENGAPTGDNPNVRFQPAGRLAEAIHYSAPDATSTLTNAKVLLLTSNRTASAAEHFALAMKSTGRGTLIGEATAGANHFGGGVELNEHFNVWLPIGRTSDVKTGKDWEGDGVAPDIVADPAHALVTALELAGLSHADAVRLDAAEVPLEPVHVDRVAKR